MITPKNTSQLNFKQWLWQNPDNKRIFVILAIVSLLAFIWLKIRYPYPNFLPDSYSYLEAAFKNQSINKWPIGYSAFLRIFSSFTRSDTMLVLVQYLLLQASLLYLLFSIRYLLSPGKWAFYIMVLGCMLNPLSLYLSNFISSDTLFAALSLIWLTQLLWILYNPTIRKILSHALVLLLVLMVRYNSLYYPLISLSIILLLSMPMKRKILSIGFIIVLLGCFVVKNCSLYHRITGTAQFAPFGGWQLASNALFAYAHIAPDTPENVPTNFKALHLIVQRDMDSLKRIMNRPDGQLGVYYLWNQHSPLNEYLQEKWKGDSVTDEFSKWASMGSIYSAYGSWLIRTHPAGFINYYLLPNAINYYVPNAEFMNIYNMGSDSVEDIAEFWFAFKTKLVANRNKEITVTNILPILLAIVNVLFLLSYTGFCLMRGPKRTSPYFVKILRLTAILWLTNMIFSVFASPVVLRYQTFPLFFTFVFSILLLEYIMSESFKTAYINGPLNQAL
jgi:hypothetical protein